MYEPQWRDLTQEPILPAVEAALPDDKLRNRKLFELKPVIATLPFYRHTSLVAFEEPDVVGANKRYFLWSPEAETQTLNWTNEPIYSANETDGMVLTIPTMVQYAQFFFHFVRGQLGRFLIVEKVEDINWLPEEGAKDRGLALMREKKINLGPAHYFGVHGIEELHVLSACVVFKNALFKTDIFLSPYDQEIHDSESNSPETMQLGTMKLVNEELLLEELPVVIDPPPGEFE